MRIVDVVEGHAFLRPINYLRIRHDYAIWYNWVYPSFLAIVVFLLAYLPLSATTAKAATVADILAPIEQYSSLLIILFPFYFASLAAMSSLGNVPSLDLKFEMKNPVTLFVKVSKTEYDTIDLTPRDFLAMLFAYCTTSSLFLLLISFAKTGLVILLGKAGAYSDDISFFFLGGYIFLFSQLLISTLLGVYFLSDYMVRNKKTPT